MTQKSNDGPQIFKINELLRQARHNETIASDGSWKPSRPAPETVVSISQRIKAAWLVLTGKADAVIWDD